MCWGNFILTQIDLQGLIIKTDNNKFNENSSQILHSQIIFSYREDSVHEFPLFNMITAAL